ncbi:OsmC family protein [Paraoerskovia marina]|uniref:Organic hydroperoxide reductase OsmC/OhrA n=1 Tax=Paraoerskovia marina TaxID=545619 RepID=A0A1H1T4N0_9CELL|nr:OsmC family protein [Paraoerskovia marina]SDS55104.1 Organic hydroperoxide reductase OsmC/OhrA [Paraoerskovia marina]
MSGATHGYTLTVRWTGAGEEGTRTYTSYSREHEVDAEGRPTLTASSDVAFRGDAALHSPEDLFVASIAQCHMLWFLHLAAADGVVVIAYEDAVSGTMRVESAGAGQFSDVTLRPRVTIDDSCASAIDPDETLSSLHRRAHDHCFLARSVNFPVLVEPNPVRVGR